MEVDRDSECKKRREKRERERERCVAGDDESQRKIGQEGNGV